VLVTLSACLLHVANSECSKTQVHKTPLPGFTGSIETQTETGEWLSSDLYMYSHIVGWLTCSTSQFQVNTSEWSCEPVSQWVAFSIGISLSYWSCSSREMVPWYSTRTASCSYANCRYNRHQMANVGDMTGWYSTSAFTQASFDVDGQPVQLG